MSQFISAFTDDGFKRIFGQDMHKDLLIDFLNDLLKDEKEIKDITFLDKEILPEQEDERSIIYDLYCTTETNEHFVVEMQRREQSWFRNRSIYYLSRSITRQGERGSKWEYDLKAVYGVFFMNFHLGDKPGKPRRDVILTDRDTGEQFSDKLRFIFIEFPSFTKTEEECETNFDKWIFILKNMEALDRMPFKAYKPIFEKLEKIVDISALSKEDRLRYDRSIRNYRDTLATLSFAEQKGLNRGLEKGLSKGRKEGLTKGRKEEKIEIARNMKAEGSSIEFIVKVTGLSAKEVERL